MKRMKKFVRSPVFWTIIVLLVVIRITAPRIILQKTNKLLSEFSPVISGHIGDLDLGIIRGAYKIKDFGFRLKDKKSEQFFFAKEIDVSVAWRELIKGKIVTDIMADELKVVLTKNVVESLKKMKNEEAEQSKDTASKVFPLQVERAEIRNSSFEFADVLSIPEAQRWRLTKVNIRASNLTPTEKSPLSIISAQAALFDDALIKAVGNLKLLEKPAMWDLDLEMQGFNLPDANAFINSKVPLTITRGKFDLYAEVISQNNKTEGYVKPFMHKADIVADEERFKGFKNAAIEISSAAANIIFQSAKNRTVATRVNFSYDQAGLKINSLDALKDAIKNGFQEEIPEGIEEKIEIPTRNKGK